MTTQPPDMRDKDGFLLRGRQPTRLETFIDASFAFAGLSVLASLLVLWTAPRQGRHVMLVACLPMWAYAALGVVMPLYAARRGKGRPARSSSGGE